MLDLTALSGKMIGAAENPVKINNEPSVIVKAEWLKDTGIFLGQKALEISNLTFDEKIKELNAQNED